MKPIIPIPLEHFLDYEIASSRLIPLWFVPMPHWVSEALAGYYANKTKRKYAMYLKFIVNNPNLPKRPNTET